MEAQLSVSAQDKQILLRRVLGTSLASGLLQGADTFDSCNGDTVALECHLQG